MKYAVFLDSSADPGRDTEQFVIPATPEILDYLAQYPGSRDGRGAHLVPVRVLLAMKRLPRMLRPLLQRQDDPSMVILASRD